MRTCLPTLLLALSTLTSAFAADNTSSLLPLDSICTDSSQCASFYCTEPYDYYGGDNPETCQAAPAGHSCTDDNLCATRKCISGSCARSADGGPCGFNSDCLSLSCNGINYTKNPYCAKSVGAACTGAIEPSDCASDGCDRGFCGLPDRYHCNAGVPCLGGATCEIPSDACDLQDVTCVAVGTCKGPASNGSPCRRDEACQSGRCGPSSKKTGLGECLDSKTAPPKARPRETCYNDNDCFYVTAAPICIYPNNDHTEQGECAPQEAYASCQKDSDCRIYNCIKSKGQCGINDIGGFCQADYDCKSGLCKNNECATAEA